MKTITLLVGACAIVALPLGTAAAGPCTAEIENLTKLLASRDAGSGPTAGPMGTTTGQHPPTSAMGAADSSTAASAAAAESAKPQHPPTATMNQATQGGGSSPRTGETVREQHPPTAAMNEATGEVPLRRRMCRARPAEVPPLLNKPKEPGGRQPTGWSQPKALLSKRVVRSDRAGDPMYGRY